MFENCGIGLYANLPSGCLSVSDSTRQNVTTPQSGGCISGGSYPYALGTAPFYTDKSVEGIATLTGGYYGEAADTMGTVGPSHVIHAVNQRIAVYYRGASPIVRTKEATLAQFFSVSDGTYNYPRYDCGDPTVIYDHVNSIWIACALDAQYGVTDNRLLFAVCTNSAPVPNNTPSSTDITWISDNWKKYVINLGETTALADYPKLGIDANGIYISALCFANNDFVNVAKIKTVALPIGPFKDGSDPIQQPADVLNRFDFIPQNGERAVQPVTSFASTAAGNVAWFLSKSGPTTSPSYRPGKTSYGQLKWNGTRFEQQSWFDSSLSISVPDTISYYDVPVLSTFEAPQGTKFGKSDTIRLSNTGTHVMTAILRNGYIYACQHVGFNQSGGYSGSADRSGIVWSKFSIDTSTTPPRLVHTSPNATVKKIWDNSSTNPYWYYFPSLMVNTSGDVLLGFSGSRTGENIGSFYFAERSTGAALSRPVLVQAGRDYFDTLDESYRWGDYSATALDPNDSLTFWTFQEYAEAEENPIIATSHWGNWFACVKPTP